MSQIPSQIPPDTTDTVHAESVLVLAPHPDDEVLGCGGLVRRWCAGGSSVRVLFLTDGGADAPEGQRADYVRRRRSEAAAAAAVLGLAGSDHLGLPDGALAEHRVQVETGLRRALVGFRPEVLLVPSPIEASEDHRETFEAVRRLFTGSSPDDPMSEVLDGLRILAFEINRPLIPNLLVDVSDELDTIERAMACYRSQQERHDYLGARLGLLRFRTLTLAPGCEGAEAYRSWSADQFRATPDDALRRELEGSPERVGAPTPGSLISVIVRTKDRPELLADALRSLEASTWRTTEIVLVNDGGEEPELPSELTLPVLRVDLETSRGRAGAANAGLAAATGDVVTFLDDDDLVEPDHLETLVGLADAAGVRVAYTDAAVGVWELGPGGWERVERRLPYRRDFDPERLLVDNYIPFHTLVVERELALEVGPFDEDLEFFEDWDFLLRLARRAPFHHHPKITCEYRQFRGSAHHVLGDRGRDRADFLATKARVIAKHADELDSECLARIVDGLREEAVVAEERSRALRRELRAVREEAHRNNGRATAAETRIHSLEEQRERLALELEGERRRVAELETARAAVGRELEEARVAGRARDRDLEAAYAEIARLTELVDRMEATRAWKAHRFLERFKG